MARRRVGSRKRKRAAVAAPIADPRGMEASVGLYLEMLRARQLTETTVSTRASGLRRFVAWCEERAILRPEEVTRPVVEAYQRWLYAYRREDGRGLSVTAQIGRLVAVRGWMGWLARTNRIAYNPASELELPRRPVRLPRDVLTADEAEAVLAAADVRTALGVRDRAMMELLYSTGMRRMEIVGLDVEDVDAERGLVMIREGKGKKDRVVPIGERALWWIGRYRLDVRPRLAGDVVRGALFVNDVGERLSGSWLTDLVRGYVERSGVKKRGACHLFRHTCATLMLEGGADIRFIQELLGHADLGTTEIYTRVSIAKLREIHRATHPARWTGPDEEATGELERVRAWRQHRGEGQEETAGSDDVE
jgi:integrase/recombinase XerD